MTFILNPAIKGAFGEITVARDLAKRGYYVFAPIVHSSAPCDLIALEPLTYKLVRIEVKSSTFRGERDNGKYDVLARYDEIKETVSYEPTLSVWFATPKTKHHKAKQDNRSSIQKFISMQTQQDLVLPATVDLEDSDALDQ